MIFLILIGTFMFFIILMGIGFKLSEIIDPDGDSIIGILTVPVVLLIGIALFTQILYSYRDWINTLIN